MPEPLRVLILEDSADDAEAMIHELNGHGYAVRADRVETEQEFLAALETGPDLILADYRLPRFSGARALARLQELEIDVPLIVVTGALGDEQTAEILRLGASDFLLKDRMGRLGAAAQQALQAKHARNEQRLLAEKLTRSEERFRLITSSAHDAIIMMDASGRCEFSNPAAQAMFGYSAQEMAGRKIHAILAPERYHDAAVAGLRNFSETGTGPIVGKMTEVCARRKDGTEFLVELSVSRFQLGDGYRATSVLRDISERKRTELALDRMNRALRILGACNALVAHADDERRLLQGMCSSITDIGGYPLAWIGFAEQGPDKIVRPVAYGGQARGYIEPGTTTWGDEPSGQGPMGRAIRSRKPQLSRDVDSDPTFAPWRARAARLGVRSALVVPLVASERAYGAVAMYASEVDGFDDEEIKLLGELADNLAFGLVALRARAENENSARRLQSNLESTVMALAAMVEMRDPFTSGHQRRVAELATAIARDLGMPEDEIRGIYLAGVLHDIGKISVPAEILSSPGKLSDIQYAIAKTHVQSGYDILKSIDFPWPIAQIVLQHHERIDGSGYPNGLANGEILPGAKILAVADTVEAMDSHRPYRPSLGLKSALDELVRGRGKLYEAAPVDSCLKLFQQDGFAFSP